MSGMKQILPWLHQTEVQVAEIMSLNADNPVVTPTADLEAENQRLRDEIAQLRIEMSALISGQSES